MIPSLKPSASMTYTLVSFYQTLWALMQALWHGRNFASIWFWWSETGSILSNLLQLSSYPTHLRNDFLSVYSTFIVPLLGPGPRELRSMGVKPRSYMGDDHSPIEFGWVVKNDGKSSIQFSIEPLSHFDGAPTPPKVCTKILNALGNVTCVKSFDTTWPDICQETLGVDPSCQENSFFLGENIARLPFHQTH
ncbi:tryptophan dimethylallyltransferase-domain-containing protein [Pholiota molesta]|nr:tryptophan dimethylallyltransferase-domain-containing protein [Pholiota molesta]